MQDEQFIYKYRPESLETMVLDEKLKSRFKSMIENRKFQNMTFLGSPGIGKTTLALCIANELNATVHFVKCAIDGKVEYITTHLKPFCDAVGIDGQPKVVILDELDSASSTQQSSFQKSLRSLIESATDTVFLCTANYNNIIDAVLSRCPVVKLEFSKHDLAKRIVSILREEKIEFDKTSLSEFIQCAYQQYYPDIRSIIHLLEKCTVNGKLDNPDTSLIDNNQQNIDSFIQYLKTNCRHPELIRKYYLSNKSQFANFDTCSSDIFNRILNTCQTINYNDIHRLSNIIYQINNCIDKEIQFYNFITSIANLFTQFDSYNYNTYTNQKDNHLIID